MHEQLITEALYLQLVFGLSCQVLCSISIKVVIKPSWDAWGITWQYSENVCFEQQMHPK